MTVDSELVAYLEDVLRRARRGEVVAFAGVGVALTPRPNVVDRTVSYEADVLVGLSADANRLERVERLRDLHRTAMLGVGGALKSLDDRVSQILASRE